MLAACRPLEIGQAYRSAVKCVGMLRLLVVPLAVLIGAGCVSQPGMLAGSGGSAATGAGGAGVGGQGGGGGIGVGASGGSGFGGAGWTCGGSDYVLKKLPPEILILLDASGSMNEDASGAVCVDGCGATSKWAETVAAINATVARTETAVSWGLKLFPESATAKCSVGNAAAVQVGPNNAAAIATALASRTSANGGLANGGNTPTRTAENAAITYLQTLTSMSPKFILLATDGLPNCVPGQSDTAVDDAAGTVQAVEYARSAGYPTFVIGVGIGNAAADATLDQMATAGGYPRAGSPAYYPVAGTAELESTLTTLVSVASSCTFALPTAPTSDGTTTRGLIGVRVDGVGSPRDPTHANGWDYTDASMNAIQIYGSVCDAITAGQAHTVSIYFYCLAV